MGMLPASSKLVWANSTALKPQNQNQLEIKQTLTPYSSASENLSYRPEIDGLRAIAVIVVILYHAEMVLLGRDWFTGGYLGVDIFFVISGYLITRIILRELSDTGTFRFASFYERRARRILPALIIVITASIPFAWFILLPTAFVEYAQSILASLFFGSNFFFFLTTTEYGADSALLKPFLHTWSLAVEEQFYVVFPIIALAVFRFFRRYFLIVVVALMAISLIYAEMLITRQPDWNFYSPFSRFWQLAAGALLAIREVKFSPKQHGIAAEAFSIVGLILIAVSVLYVFGPNSRHPGFLTMLPVVGTALIIGFGTSGGWVGALLSHPAMRGIGLVSYSAYLWHFPIFAFARLQLVYFSNIEKVAAIAITFALSALSYFVIEQPFRKKGLLSIKQVVAILSASVFACLTALYFMASAKTGSRSAPSDPAIATADKLYELDNMYLLSQRDNNFGRGWSYFRENFNSPNTKLLVWGDSHGFDFFQTLQASKYADRYNIRFCGLRLVYFEEDKSGPELCGRSI